MKLTTTHGSVKLNAIVVILFFLLTPLAVNISGKTKAKYEEGEPALLRHIGDRMTTAGLNDSAFSCRMLIVYTVDISGHCRCDTIIGRSKGCNEITDEFKAQFKTMFENLPGRWKPQLIDGKPVTTRDTMPFHFHLQ